MDYFSDITRAALATAKPTEAQAQAGNYRKGRVEIHGLKIAIETPRGQYREGVGRDGKPWSNLMKATYGHFEKYKGNDGDGVDCFIGEYPETESVWIINQRDPDSGKFDEHKVMLGFTDQQAAHHAYQKSYSAGWNGMMNMIGCSVAQLDWWLQYGDKTIPVSIQNLPYQHGDNMNKESALDGNPNWKDQPRNKKGEWENGSDSGTKTTGGGKKDDSYEYTAADLAGWKNDDLKLPKTGYSKKTLREFAGNDRAGFEKLLRHAELVGGQFDREVSRLGHSIRDDQVAIDKELEKQGWKFNIKGREWEKEGHNPVKKMMRYSPGGDFFTEANFLTKEGKKVDATSGDPKTVAEKLNNLTKKKSGALDMANARDLSLDSVTVADIMADADAILGLDALVLPYAKIDLKMKQMMGILKIAAGDVKPTAFQVTEPFRQKGTTQVAAVFEMDDGQTVSVFFHNPDITPNKITPQDDLVSWKWLLNRKDVTIVVAPEKGQDLNVREVSRRVMKLVDKNSERFKKANEDKAARMETLASVEREAEEKAGILTALNTEIAELEAKKESGVPKKAVSGDVLKVTNREGRVFNVVYLKGISSGKGSVIFYDATYQGKKGFHEYGQFIANYLEETVMQGKGGITLNSGVPEWFIDAENRKEIKEWISSKKAIAAANAAVAAQAWRSDSFDPIANYKEIMGNRDALIAWQDRLDSFFNIRIVDIRNALSDMGWNKPAEEKKKWPMEKSGALLELNVLTEGAGANVVGAGYVVKKGGNSIMQYSDDLSKTPKEVAEMIDAAIPKESDADIPFFSKRGGKMVISSPDGKTDMPSDWTGIAYGDGEVKFWLIGQDAGERSFTALKSKTIEEAREEAKEIQAAIADDRSFLQSAIDGKVDFYDKTTTNRIAEIDKRSPAPGDTATLVLAAKKAAKDFLIAEFKKKVA